MVKKRYFGLAICLLLGMFFVGVNQGFSESPHKDNQESVLEGDVDQDKEKAKKSMDIVKFELEIELTDNTELEWEYKRNKKKVKAEIELGDKEIKGPEAIKEMESILSKLTITKDMKDDAIVAHVLKVVKVSPKDVKKLELELKCFPIFRSCFVDEGTHSNVSESI